MLLNQLLKINGIKSIGLKYMELRGKKLSYCHANYFESLFPPLLLLEVEKRLVSLTHFSLPSHAFLTLNCLACQIRYVWLNFEFYIKKG